MKKSKNLESLKNQLFEGNMNILKIVGGGHRCVWVLAKNGYYMDIIFEDLEIKSR